MRRHRFSALAIFLSFTVVSTAAFARDPLEDLVKKKSLSRADKASIEAEVNQRADRLAGAGSSEDRRAKARETLVSTSQVKDATAEGRAAYADACGTALAGLVTNKEFTIAFDAVFVLVALDDAATSRSLSRGLRSDHPAVRYSAARGLTQLHKKLTNPKTCAAVLKTLGKYGARERDPIVLNEIYRAIDFGKDVSGFQQGDEAARALNKVFASRLSRLAAGSQDEFDDELGYAAAASCYSGAGARQQSELAGHMLGFLTRIVDRFFAPDTARSAKPTLRQLASKAEDVVHSMIRASKVSLPDCHLKTKLDDKKPNSKEVRACLDELRTVLAGDPWKVR